MSGRVGSITTGIITDRLVFNMDAANRASYPRTGTTTTDTVSDNVGTLNGTTFSTTDNGIFDLDGVDDNIGLSTNINFDKTDPFTINSWVKVNSVGGSDYDVVITNQTNGGNYRGYYLQIGASGIVTLIFRSTLSDRFFFSTSATLSAGAWSNICVTYDGNNSSSSGKAFINGAGVSTSETTSTSAISGTTNGTIAPIIGSRQTGPSSNPFNGDIGNIQIYNRALSANEVLHNYNALKGRFGL
jgi:hypothetical protein